MGLRRLALLGLALASVTAPLVSAADRGGPTLRGSNFFSNCPFSHTSMNDPIVYPGQPGRSHAHTFFGNRTTDAASTPGSLRGARTTCKPRADKAAYWVPTLYQNGREVRPAKAQFYYVLRGYSEMHPFPAGLGMRRSRCEDASFEHGARRLRSHRGARLRPAARKEQTIGCPLACQDVPRV